MSSGLNGNQAPAVTVSAPDKDKNWRVLDVRAEAGSRIVWKWREDERKSAVDVFVDNQHPFRLVSDQELGRDVFDHPFYYAAHVGGVATENLFLRAGTMVPGTDNPQAGLRAA